MAGSQQTQTLKVRGLHTNPSQYGSNVPEGASNVCDNITLDRESFAQTRRGFYRYGTPLGTNTAVTEIMQYGNDLICHTDNGNLYYDSDQQGTWVQYPGTYSSPSTDLGSRIRSAESMQNLYFTTSGGVYMLDKLTDTPVLAGAPVGLGGAATLVPASGGFMANNTNVAYRVVWGYTDANNRLILGPPSERILVSNTSGGACNVKLDITVPQMATGNWVYQVYRSFQSVDQNTPPNDELQQCAQGSLAAVPGYSWGGQIIALTDTTPDALLQASLYTNPSQDGIAQSNYMPPFAQDIAVYKGYTFYANTRSVHRLNVTFTGTTTGGGAGNGGTLFFCDGVTGQIMFIVGGGYTWSAFGQTGNLENQTQGRFGAPYTGNPAVDVAALAQSMVKIINLFPHNNAINAYYQSDWNQLPGQIRFERRDLNSNPFFVVDGGGGLVFAESDIHGYPGLAYSRAGNTSTNDVAPNRLFYSKFQQPEAVPLLNYFDVGSAKQPITRIIALRDSLIILKPDGVWRLYGLTASNFTLVPLDNTVKILAPNTAVVLDNYAYFLSSQGVVAVSDSSTQIISRPIETDLLALTALDNFPNFADHAFAISYESDRKYILGMQVNSTDDGCPQQYTYNYITQDWTRWTRTMTCGRVNLRDNKIYYGGPDDPVNGASVYVERKTYTQNDFADEQFTINILSAVGYVVTVASTATLAVGNTLYQSQDVQAVITEIVNPTTVLVDNVVSWATGPTTVYVQINDVLETIQLDAQNPGIMKHFKSVSYIFSDANFDNLTIKYNSDTTQTEVVQMLANDSGVSWGYFDFGDEPWGGQLGGKKRIETRVPRSLQRADWITVNIQCGKAFSSFGLSGVSIVYTTMTERKGGNQAQR